MNASDRLGALLAAAASVACALAAVAEPAPPAATVPYGCAPATNAPPSLVLRAGGEPLARVWLSADATALHVACDVTDPSPLRNSGRDGRLLFKTGDSFDLQLGTDPDAAPARAAPAPGDVRVLVTLTSDVPVAVVYRYVVPGTTDPVAFGSPMGHVAVDRVESLADARIAAERRTDGYRLQLALPWATLAGRPWQPAAGLTLRGDVGVLFSDPDGAITVERVYWANRDTTVVADVPTEIRLHPDRWGAWTLTPHAPR